MGQDEREPPFFFAKPADALVPDGGTVPYPSLTKDMHHEVELVVALKSGGRNIPVDKALDCVWGYGVGIDLTRRDLQIASRDIKRPWEVGKAFDASAPCGPLKPVSQTRPSEQGQDRAQVQRQGPPGRRPRADDLERAGDDLEAVGDGGARRRRHHHDRHAVGRRGHASPATSSNARSTACRSSPSRSASRSSSFHSHRASEARRQSRRAFSSIPHCAGAEPPDHRGRGMPASRDGASD